MNSFAAEVEVGRRFEFGKNWRSFLATLTDERIAIAENSLIELLGISELHGKRFLDIGSGSGLFSLAARKLGAEVRSFDFDPSSVACTEELRSRYFPSDAKWVVTEGSVLDTGFLRSIGSYEIVYSWGVLHHTGNMWAALANAASVVDAKGTLVVAIYNDQGSKSRWWRRVKQFYCSGAMGKAIVSGIFIPYFFFRALASCVLRRENVFAKYKHHRGMSIVHDWIDWLGGLPFEVASVEAIVGFFRERGFVLSHLATTNGLGNNQFVFGRETSG